MPAKKPKSRPTWTDLKAKLADFDHAGLLGLIHDLYAASKDNQLFLNSRFGLGADLLKPYKEVIDKALYPNVMRNIPPSVAKAKQAISHYKKANGDPAGLAELLVFFCESGSAFGAAYGYTDEPYLEALLSAFGQALAALNPLSEEAAEPLLVRLQKVRDVSRIFGYGIGDTIGDMFVEYCVSIDREC